MYYTTKKILADTCVVILLSLSLLLCFLSATTTNFVGVFAEQEFVLPIGKEFELLCELEDFEKANEVARKLAREVIERGGGSGGGNNFYNVRARESGRLRFTHDTSEYGSEETMNSESLMQRTANTGNGVICQKSKTPTRAIKIGRIFSSVKEMRR